MPSKSMLHSVHRLLSQVWPSNEAPSSRGSQPRHGKRRALRFELCEGREMLAGHGMLSPEAASDAASAMCVAAVLAQIDPPVATQAAVNGVANPSVTPNVAASNANIEAPIAMPLATNEQNLSYIGGLYRIVLQRPADAGGLQAWVSQINGGASLLTIATSFWESIEHRTLQVNSYYTSFLGRAPDAIGQQLWVNNMLGGVPEETVIASFINSNEYQAAHPPNNVFVYGLYSSLLQRTPDIPGAQGWIDQLNAGSLTTLQVVQAFINSDEYHTLIVRLAYQTILVRDPDPAGWAFYVNQLNTGVLQIGTLNETFLSSTEFFNLVANPGT